MIVHVYQKGASGIPTTNLAAPPFTPSDLSFSHAALWGPLTATVTIGGTRDDAFTMADTWLGNAVEIYSPDGEWLWEGLIWTVSFSYGRRSRRRSLEGYANRCEVYYRHDTGSLGSVVQEDTTQQAIYGVICHTTTGDNAVVSQAQALALAERTLAERMRLLWLPESGTLGSDSGGDAVIELECYGWYRTLWYDRYVSPYGTSGTQDIDVLLADVLDDSAPFLSSDRRLADTGAYTANQYYEIGTPPGDVIKATMQALPGYTFRLDQGRVPVLEADKRLSTTPDYLEDVFGTLTNSAGQPVPLWNVRPDSVVRQQDFVPTGQFSDAEVDKISAVYLAETEWRMPGVLSFKTAVAGERGEID